MSLKPHLAACSLSHGDLRCPQSVLFAGQSEDAEGLLARLSVSVSDALADCAGSEEELAAAFQQRKDNIRVGEVVWRA